MASRLTASEVLVVDCQSTGSTPAHGHLLELGWARFSCDREPAELAARVLSLPVGAAIPPMVSKLTGLTPREVDDGVPKESAWRELDLAARRVRDVDALDVTPTVIHFAQFEERFLRDLHSTFDDPFPFRLDIVCTHAIARRLLPSLPRRSLRALAGYYGFSSTQLRRSRDHVEATCFVWRNLVRQLEDDEDICTWEELRSWLSTKRRVSTGRAYPMPKEKRLALPDAPGVYRFLRANGDLLYVGKATSLKKRVNSHFRKKAKSSERSLEMLTQARDLEFVETATPLEAALLESDEIKKHEPPYNVALLEEGRHVWFASRDLASFTREVDEDHPLGPLPSRYALAGIGTLHRLLAMDSASVHVYTIARALGIMAASAPDDTCFADGLMLFRQRHFGGAEVPAPTLGKLEKLARTIAKRLAVDPRVARDEDEVTWDAERVFEHLEEALSRAPQLLARARWLTHLADATVAFREPGESAFRALAIAGTVTSSLGFTSAGSSLAVPPRPRGQVDRQRCFDVVSYDRLRVLTTELKRIVRDGGTVFVRFGPGRTLTGEDLATALRGI